MSKDPTQLATVQMMLEGGGGNVSRIPADSLMGQLYRPIATSGWPGQAGVGQMPQGRIATLETLFDFFINSVPNPDWAFSQDPDFDEKIHQQPDVQSAFNKRSMTVASLPRIIKPSTHSTVDRAEATQMAEYIKEVFEHLPNLHQVYRQMELAVLTGGTGFEMTYGRDASGVDILRNIDNVHQTRFMFDRLGNMGLLTRETPVWGSYINVNPTRLPGTPEGEHFYSRLPRGKFMYHLYMAEGGPWARPAAEGYMYWGRGESMNLYLIVTFDLFVLRFRMKWLERFGFPLTLLYYNDNDSRGRAEVQAIAKSIRGEGMVTIPMGSGPEGKEQFYALDFPEPPTAGYDAFAQFTEGWTRPCADKILLAGAEQMSIGQEGSFGASVNQDETGPQMIYRWDAMCIDGTINTQLIPYMIRAVPKWRHVPVHHMPRHCMTPERQRNRGEELDMLERLAKMVPIRKADVYEAAGYQQPKDGKDGTEKEDVVFLGQQEGFDGASGMPTPGSAGGEDPDELRKKVEQLSKQGKQDLRASLRRFSDLQSNRSQAMGQKHQPGGKLSPKLATPIGKGNSPKQGTSKPIK